MCVAIMGVSASSCQRLDLQRDASLEIIQPDASSTIPTLALPLDLAWRDTEPSAYAVFVDGNPMAAGGTVLSLLADNDPCHSRPGCPDAAWLAQHQIVLTDVPHIHVDRLVRTGSEVDGGTGTAVHRATIVRVDGDGRRTSDAAWSTEFRVRR